MTFHDSLCPCLDCQHLRALLKATPVPRQVSRVLDHSIQTLAWFQHAHESRQTLTAYDRVLLKMLGIQAW